MAREYRNFPKEEKIKAVKMVLVDKKSQMEVERTVLGKKKCSGTILLNQFLMFFFYGIIKRVKYMRFINKKMIFTTIILGIASGLFLNNRVIFIVNKNIYLINDTKKESNSVPSPEIINVKLNKCVDGDTAEFIINNEIKKVRFLAIDTPETKHPTKGIEEYGTTASEYTCNKLKKAQTIKLEFDAKNKVDKYNRYLAFVFVDDILLQDELLEKGLGKVAYIYGTYRYTNQLCFTQKKAMESRLGVWEDADFENDYCLSKKIITLDNITSPVKKENQLQEELILVLEFIFVAIIGYIFRQGRRKIKKSYQKINR